MSGWYYLKFYVGAATTRLDPLIVKLIPELASATSAIADRWFFIRYIDEGGVHLRIRFHAAAPEHHAELNRVVDQVCQRSITLLAALAASTYRSALPIPTPAMPASAVGLIPDVYEPEVAKFGVTSMSVAERLFQVSSELAVEILRSDLANKVSRKTVAPLLMHEVVRAFPSPRDFWYDYADYWLTSAGASSSEWPLRFAAKSDELARRGIAIRTPVDELPPEAGDWIERWRVALRTAAARYDQLDVPGAIRDGLGFQIAHLMNNRLGLSTLEESYFATLLARSFALEVVA
jgi:hypothetical protein